MKSLGAKSPDVDWQNIKFFSYLKYIRHYAHPTAWRLRSLLSFLANVLGLISDCVVST